MVLWAEEYWLVRFLFQRGLALIYLLAFLVTILVIVMSIRSALNMLSLTQVMNTSFDPFQTMRDDLQRAPGAERFVRLIVGGGIGLVAGLWIVTLSTLWSVHWLVGIALAVLGTVWLLGGIVSQIE